MKTVFLTYGRIRLFCTWYRYPVYSA
jgi:hypothetical protein